MLLADLVETSGVVAATRSRKAKVAAIAERLGQADVTELPVVTAYLGGTVLQRRTGVGWRGLSTLPDPAAETSLTPLEVHDILDRLAALSGPGSQESRANGVRDLFGRATADEQRWLRGALTGNVRQGALDALVQEAIAAASGRKLTVVRRAAMLAGGTVPIVVAAMTGGEDALADVGLEVGRPVLPMLASTAPDITTAMAKAGGAPGTPVAVDTKLDGIRIQVHRHGDEIVIATRSLDEITARLPEVVDVVRALPTDDVVLDGEALRTGRRRPAAALPGDRVAHRDEGGRRGHAVLLRRPPPRWPRPPRRDRCRAPRCTRRAGPEEHRVPRLVTDDPVAAEAFRPGRPCPRPRGGRREEPRDRVRRRPPRLRLGQGQAGAHPRPGRARRRVGSGRREGRLSNIHLGARNPDGTFTMLGKTFKGMTDEMLAWQTERFTELAVDPATIHDSYVVPLRPEQVVEIAFDGVQRSTRYEGGVALRFARVVRYRDDKSADEADTIETVQALAAG